MLFPEKTKTQSYRSLVKFEETVGKNKWSANDVKQDNMTVFAITNYKINPILNRIVAFIAISVDRKTSQKL